MYSIETCNKMRDTIGSYRIEKYNDGNLKIDYKRSSKDIIYSLVPFVISIPILFFDFKLSTYLVQEEMGINLIIPYFFSICLLVFGLYLLVSAIETAIKPTNKVFFINASQKQLTIKLNLFKKLQLNFSDIKHFNIGAKDITITNHHEGSTRKRQLFLIFMHVKLSNNKTIKIHQFESTNIFISPFDNKKTDALIDFSKQITDLISKECDKKFYWKGIEKE